MHYRHEKFVSRRGFKQVLPKEGGGIREIKVDSMELDVSAVKEIARDLFFPQGLSPFGHYEDMELKVLTDNAGRDITEFRDRNDKQCNLKEYMKSYGLFGCKNTFFLKTKTAETKSENPAKTSESQNAELLENQVNKRIKLSSDCIVNKGGAVRAGQSNEEKENRQTNDFILRLPGTEDRDTFTTTQRNDDVSNLFVIGVDGLVSCKQEDLCVTYCSETSSSFDEVVISKYCHSRSACKEFSGFKDPDILENMQSYDPLENGFFVRQIKKNNTIYLDFKCENDENTEKIVYTFPAYEHDASNDNKLIVFPPSVVNGYDQTELLLGVVIREHGECKCKYTWFKDGQEILSGPSNCILHVSSTGIYSCTVEFEERVEVSEPVQVIEVLQKAPKDIENEKINVSYTIPEVDKEEIEFTDVVLGEGAFGKVTVGKWAGLDVAVKHIKFQNRKSIKKMVEKEIKINARIRHPNIVQLIAMASESQGVYLVEEYIIGCNMDDSVFDETIRKKLKWNEKKKSFVIKQCVQAIAYLHQLNPPVIHRDIKPANALISYNSLITKICDLGISKIKGVATMTTTIIGGHPPGTPVYMAPEILLENGEATEESDMWSLAITILEFDAEEEAWESNHDDLDDGDYLKTITRYMKMKKSPPTLEKAKGKVWNVMAKCLCYQQKERPTAKQVIEYLETAQ